MSIFVTDNVAVQRFAIALFDTQVGTTTMGQVDKMIARNGVDATFNSYFAAGFGSQTTAAVAATIVANVGITGAGVAGAVAYVVAQLNAAAPEARGAAVAKMLNAFSGMTADATYGTAATAWNANVAAATAYTGADNVAVGALVTQYLTTGQDIKNGTSLSDLFIADLIGNTDSFQSGDRIEGGAGVDALDITFGDASTTAIIARTNSVEIVSIRSQANNIDGNNGDNNVSAGGVADGFMNDNTVDAENMDGVTQWWSSNSRADLVIEDIRIEDNQVTKDITIGWSNADPSSVQGTSNNAGAQDKVDYEVYFSPESLRKTADVKGTAITLSISNPLRVVDLFDAANPLKDNPYTDVQFGVNGTNVVLDLAAAGIATATTYAALWTVMQAALATEKAANPLLANVTMTRIVNGEQFFSKDGVLRFADQYELRTTNGTLSVVSPGWLADKGLPPDNAFAANVNEGTDTASGFLITSTVILDNVGRESEAGDLVIGSMSTRTGVERFEVTVENNGNTSGEYTSSGSWVGSMSSTNNFLREVVAVNGTALATGAADYLYVGTGMDDANNNLTTIRETFTSVQSNSAGGGRARYQAELDAALLNTDGLTDVRVFDASAMTGQVKVGANISAAATRKYQDLVDTAFNHALDNVAFEYSTGSGNDSINLTIDGGISASNSHIVTGRGDFSFKVNGGAGADHIQVGIHTGAGGNQDWYINQKINANVTVNGGEGNDTIRTPGAGDMFINGDAGNDRIYSDNTGNDGLTLDNADASGRILDAQGKAVYVFNAADEEVDDLESMAAVSVSAVNARLTVTFKHLTKTVDVANSVGSLTNVTITDLHINQAIKDAINNDATLSALLVAEDGPGRTLLVRSLIDGVMVTSDLGVAMANSALTTGQLAVSPALNLFDAGTSDEWAVFATARYVTDFGQEGTVDMTGADSLTATDNTINGGTGNDVIVLSTTGDGINDTTNTATAATLAASNETIVFEGSFGNDVIVNFKADTDPDTTDTEISAGFDILNFRSYLVAGTATTLDGTIDAMVNSEIDRVGANTAGQLTVTAITAAYNAVDTTTAARQLLIQVNTDTNVATVYTVVDGTGLDDVVVTSVGTIDLADTTWSNLAAANFA
jgi:hypothetical protein